MDKVIKEFDTQSRDWGFTVNNPILSDKEMYEYLKSIQGVKYCIFVREKGDGSEDNPNGTEHHQGYIEFNIPTRFSKVKALFSSDNIGVNAHIAPRQHSRLSCVNYIKKTGFHSDKKHTQLSDIYEIGDFSLQGKRNDIIDMYEMKRDGFSDLEITMNYPQYAHYNNFINKLALEEKTDKYKNKYREMTVIYISGPTRSGKTRYVYEKYGYENVYTAEGYDVSKMFDGYEGQDVLLLDEFRSDIPLGTLLRFIDGHPIKSTCRYNNKRLAFTKVYIVSNWTLEEQYPNLQLEDKETWKAFIARLTGVYVFHVEDEFDFFEMCEDRCREAKNKLNEIRKKYGLPPYGIRF